MIQGHEKTIEIIMSLIDRYNMMMPDIFKKLNVYEKELLQTKPRHTFCKEDCQYVMKQFNVMPMLGSKFDVISEVVLLLYNWYKSKQIYTIEDETKYNEDVRIDREKLKLFPYSGLYLDLEFYSLDYVGCFITLTREPCGASLRRYMLIGFVEYKKKMHVYAIDPFMLELQDGVKIEEAFMNWCNSIDYIVHNINRNVIASFIAVTNLYNIIDSNNAEKEIKHPSSVKRKITTKTLSADKDDNIAYRITHESKYKYKSNTNNKGTGSPKAPHTRRTHNRLLAIKDAEGNIIGEKVINIREMKIHAEQENSVTVKRFRNM